MELPERRLPRRPAVPAPPVREDEEEPGGHRERNKRNEAWTHDDDEEEQDRDRDCRRGEHLDLVAPHPAQQTVVLFGWDLQRVPRAAALLALPALSVREVPCLAALARDRDRRLRHPVRL